MPYTRHQKQQALKTLRDNNDDLKQTSQQTKISVSTLRKWRDEQPDLLTRLEQHMASHALTLAENLLSDDQTAPLNQRASALGMLVDRLLKFEARRKALEQEDTDNIIEVVYRDPDGSLHDKPRWWREGDDGES